MWLITGPFDSEQQGDEVPQKTKLLKPSRVYGVGRHQDVPLSINNKKVSRQNGEFVVGQHTEDDVTKPNVIPTLSLRNTKSASLKVGRGDSILSVDPGSTTELKSGDVVRLAGNISATVMWDPKVCFYTPSDDMPIFDPVACAAIGLKLVTRPTSDVTHHIISKFMMPVHPSILLSLLNLSHLVTPEWLVEFITRGNDAAGLEKTYNAPPESTYHPLIDPTFADQFPTMVNKRFWSPNESRKRLFGDMKFIFVVLGSGVGSSTKAMSEVVSRGKGEHRLINVESEAEQQAKGAAGLWGGVLKKKKLVLKEGMRSGLVLAGDQDTLAARGVPRETRKAWENMVERAKSTEMRVIPPSLIAEAVIKTDASVLDCVIEQDAGVCGEDSSDPKPLPDFVPSTLPEEPSQLPSTAPKEPRLSSNTDDAQLPVAGPSKRLIRRVTSQTPAPDPESVSEPVPAVVPMEIEEETRNAPRKRPLKRRAKTGGLINEILGLDDSTTFDEPPMAPSQSESVPPDPVPPTPVRPSRLKRRAGTAMPSSQLFLEIESAPQDVGDEPPLKKFKALFEESGQGNVISHDETESNIAAGGSGGIAETQLGTVMEEEEEEEEPSQGQTQSKKRKADAMDEDSATAGADVEMQEAAGASLPKKRAIDAVNAVERSKQLDLQSLNATSRAVTTIKNNAKTTKKGAAPGKPDTDISFLRALASNKRGKKTEDDFDREFNQLRIAKPDINLADPNASHAVQWAQEWDGLDDFEKDVGVRGNFMQIVELKVWKDICDAQPGNHMRRETGLGARLDWDGRDDFKKFRRKMANVPREVVKLVVNDQQADDSEAPNFDYSRGKAVRSFDDLSQGQSQDQAYSYPVFTQTPAGSKTRTKSQSKPKPKPKPTYAEIDDDDDAVEEVVGGTKDKGKGKSHASTKKKVSQPPRKKTPLFDLESEEEDVPEPSVYQDETLATIKDSPDITLRTNTQTQRETRARGTKRKAVVEEDSDQGLTFGGFSKKKKRK
ncbi:hypothetical protein K439DRAFT_1661840 [Ramaria rubella]|nr:hypothetical protein K439DRAFT_1661840 [Ramaria rubella]